MATGIETAPTVSGSLNVGASKVLQGTPSPLIHNNFASLQVGYEVDLWGKLARQRDAVE
jgi:outer membrane protein TolC